MPIDRRSVDTRHKHRALKVQNLCCKMPGMEILPYPVLTVAALEEKGWEPALALPLPARPSFQLLDMAGNRILDYLAWVVTDLAQTDPDRATGEIQRIAARLIEIAAATPASLTAALDADAKSFQACTNADQR